MSRVIRAARLDRGLPALLRRLDELVVEVPLGEADVGSTDVDRDEAASSNDHTAREEHEAALEAAREAAYRAGFADGQRATLEKLVKPMGEQRKRLEMLLSSLEQLHNAVRSFENWAARQARGEAIQLGLLLAGRILRKQVALTPEVLVELMDELLRGEESVTLLEVRVAPVDRETVMGKLEILCRYAPEGAEPRVIADPEIEAGFVLITDRGGIDARFDTQLEKLGEQIEQVIAVEDT